MFLTIIWINQEDSSSFKYLQIDLCNSLKIHNQKVKDQSSPIYLTCCNTTRPSFLVDSEVLDDLRKEMQNSFADLSHKDAFDLLYKESRRPEEGAIGNSTLPLHGW